MSDAVSKVSSHECVVPRPSSPQSGRSAETSRKGHHILMEPWCRYGTGEDGDYCLLTPIVLIVVRRKVPCSRCLIRVLLHGVMHAGDKTELFRGPVLKVESLELLQKHFLYIHQSTIIVATSTTNHLQLHPFDSLCPPPSLLL